MIVTGTLVCIPTSSKSGYFISCRGVTLINDIDAGKGAKVSEAKRFSTLLAIIGGSATDLKVVIENLKSCSLDKQYLVLERGLDSDLLEGTNRQILISKNRVRIHSSTKSIKFMEEDIIIEESINDTLNNVSLFPNQSLFKNFEK